MPRRWASPSRSPTTSSTSRAMPRRPARRCARTPRPARRPSSRSSGSTAREGAGGGAGRRGRGGARPLRRAGGCPAGGRALRRLPRPVTEVTMTDRPKTPLLDRVHVPADLRQFTDAELRRVADELRAETISRGLRHRRASGRGARRGGADRRAPRRLRHAARPDDLGRRHQCYPHKILTGRRDRIRTLRQKAGSRASPSARKAPTTPSARRIPRPRSRPRSASPWRATWAAPRTGWATPSR
jgi:hypothetical protein